MGNHEEKLTVATPLDMVDPITDLPPFPWLDFMLKCVLILNLLDGVFTLIWIKKGFAEEANLFLRGMVHNSPVSFIVVKILLVSGCSLVLWKNRKHPFAEKGLFLVFAVYSAIFLYHMHFLNMLLRL